MKKIYLASPFFNDGEIGFIEKAERILDENPNVILFSPRKNEDRTAVRDMAWSLATFQNDVRGLNSSDAVVMMYYGNYSDSGTAWECGYAYASGKPVIVVHLEGDEASNLMIHEGCHANITLDELAGYDFEALPIKKYSGKLI